MSSDIAIKVSGLGKCYHLYDAPRHRLLQILFGKKRQFFREYWALSDVSFDVRKGETIGIIGRNGAGKSTLLQMLCGTLHPTAGTVQVNGRLAALLELGAGFNPEFTGRENVFLSGALHGLSNAQIQERFDDIAAFADIGGFIDQAVKTYSTGMFVRLAFAVQVHLDPDVFVIDEALAVGDQRFVQKCYRKLEELKSRGTSLLFVSHDTTAIKMLSDRAVWIHDGKLRKIGDASTVVDAYRNWADGISESIAAPAGTSLPIDKQADLAVNKVSLLTSEGRESSTFIHGESVTLSIDIQNRGLPVGIPIRLGFSARNNRGVEIFGSNTFDSQVVLETPEPGASMTLKADFRLPLLAAGVYTMSLNVDALNSEGNYEAEVMLVDFFSFHIDERVKVYTLIGVDVNFKVGQYA
ncbi:ABC-type polysaccharide/polyol phosphate transport system, ATPase component [Noviherbaspirillum humi]|uniref:ABC-type polysaccharide/polyol phosphate transport system, ATPase component n=1 Tax=Noviherbaspirillum humi TaxID=1688639 RepID=A0A239CTY5_9BURK|nr:ABC transporter ATP-binding protein [Noviherbaspirillum humi]SNS23570.1 ABC-type polysaccharide/polyol phosphate transport system, ATPase component [Noviherbaspirillum humi]